LTLTAQKRVGVPFVDENLVDVASDDFTLSTRSVSHSVQYWSLREQQLFPYHVQSTKSSVTYISWHTCPTSLLEMVPFFSLRWILSS